MADEDLVGGISVSLGASDAKLVGDLAAAERLVQEWAKQAATVELRATFKGGTATGGTGGGQDLAQLTKAIEQGFSQGLSKFAVGPAARQAAAQQPTVRAVSRATAVTAAARGGDDPFLRAVNAELAKTGEHLASLTDNIENTATATVKQRRAVETATRIAPAEAPRAGAADLHATVAAVVSTLASNPSLLTKISRASLVTGSSSRSLLSAEDTERLSQLSAQREAQNNPPSAAVIQRPTGRSAPGLSLGDAKAARDIRDAEIAAAFNTPRPRRRPTADSAAVSAAQRRDEEVFARTSPNTDDAREQRIQEDIARRRANITASGSTGRTSASRIGSLLGGNQGRLIEAETRLAAARRATTEANRAAAPFERNIAIYNDDIANSSGKVADRLTKQREAFKDDPKTVAAFKRQTEAIQGEGKALSEFEKLQSGGNIARNLSAVALGSFAFSAALKAVDIGVQAVGAAVGPTLERLSGFAATTAAYTGNLADATRAANGNVQAVTALKLAGTGLSASTAATIQPLIQQRAQVEAGNKAIQDQIDSLHVFENLRRSNQQAGITSTTGGLLGTAVGGIPSTGEQIGNLLAQQGAAARVPAPGRQNTSGRGPQTQTAAASQSAQADFASSLELVNGQLEKGGDASAKFSQAADKADSRIEQTAASFDNLSPAMAAAIRDNHLYSDGIHNVADALKALQAINIAGTLPDPALLAQQFARQRQATINALGRQQDYTLNNQLPAQAALQNLAQPLTPVGTGIPGGAQAPGQQKAIDLQKQLNDYYAQGQKVLEDTYKPSIVQNFRQAAGQAFQTQIDGITQLGTEIAGLQADMANTSAVQQTKQYNEQLRLATRSLSDIGGLTGQNFGAGQSYLGQLEKENLALSRQSQLLQFAMSQRQINFQTALAGFQAPGVTPEERQANVREAQFEASFAQKQLNISKQSFGNQVQIVDISNLREGADLARQIGLLISGRKASIKIAVDQQELVRAQQRSAQLVQQAGVYLGSIDTLAGQAIGEIQQLEVAAGKALTSVAQQVLTAYGVVIKGITSQLNGGTDTGNFANPTGFAGGHGAHASGVIGNTSGPTSMTVGEAGTETVAVLRNPRAFMGAMGGGGGSVNFYGDFNIRSEADIDLLVRKVSKALGRDAALKGLRSAG